MQPNTELDLLPIPQEALDDAEATANREAVPNLQELLELWAIDTELFSHEFFPKTVRQQSPTFHAEMDEILDDPAAEFICMQIFRGGAKTTKLRLYTAKRIAFGISRTILYIGLNQAKAIQSLDWIKTQIEKNKHFTRTFQLERGKIWAQDEIEIVHRGASEFNPATGEYEPLTIRVLAVGITGGHRGINIEDWRPDLVLVDDVVDEENAKTHEGRQKIFDLVMGSLKNGMSPKSESPLRKFVVLQTPMHDEDLSGMCFKHPEFKCIRRGCWTEATKGMPLEYRESIWPERWSSETLRRERNAHIALNKLSLFSREMECSLITPENSLFKPDWLRYWGDEPGDEQLPPVHDMFCILVIDPVPPPSESQIAAGLANKDFEALGVVGVRGGKYYVCEISSNRGHEPDWTVSEFFRLAYKWRVRRVIVESIAYQRVLVWLLKSAMQRVGKYFPVEPYVDKRKKPTRITQGITGVASNKMLFISREMTTFRGQFAQYPNVDHDDELEVVAIGCEALQYGSFENDGESGVVDDESEYKALTLTGGAP